MVDSPFDINENEDVSNQADEGRDDSSYPRSIVVGVLMLSAIVVVLVFWQMKYNLTLEIPTFGRGELVFEEIDESLLRAADEQLKLQDSDEDGLTDFEELRIYGSSPFIADTDSDGISDFEEIQLGQDPNCPQGKNCFAPQIQDEDVLPESTLQSEELQRILSDPAAIKKLLIQQGAKTVFVNSLDDQTLQMLAQEAFLSLGSPSQALPSLEKLAELEKIPPDELRVLLEESGISKEELDALTDEELGEIYLELLSQAKEEFFQSSGQ